MTGVMGMTMVMEMAVVDAVNVFRFRHAQVFYVEAFFRAAPLHVLVVGWLTTRRSEFVDEGGGGCHYQKRRILRTKEQFPRSASTNRRR